MSGIRQIHSKLHMVDSFSIQKLHDMQEGQLILLPYLSGLQGYNINSPITRFCQCQGGFKSKVP